MRFKLGEKCSLCVVGTASESPAGDGVSMAVQRDTDPRAHRAIFRVISALCARVFYFLFF